MSELEAMERRYLFKMKRSKRVKDLIARVHGLGSWTRFDSEWELKESTLQLYGWKRARRVVVRAIALKLRALKDLEQVVVIPTSYKASGLHAAFEGLVFLE